MNHRRRFLLKAGAKSLALGESTVLMGIVNLTPDSFSDGGRFSNPDHAVAHAVEMAEAGADILDLGGESTRPGSLPVSPQAEMDRVLPVLERLRPRFPGLISVDTTKAVVARAALRLGADMINDISGLLFDPELPGVIAATGAAVVLMHTRGRPATMQQLPPSPDILREVREGLETCLGVAASAGIERGRILLDPGIGFGKTVADNLLLINRLAELAELGMPLLIGPSRKSFIGHVLERPASDRLLGTVAACAAAIFRGAHALRVHDVAEVVQVVRMVDSILAEAPVARPRNPTWEN